MSRHGVRRVYKYIRLASSLVFVLRSSMTSDLVSFSSYLDMASCVTSVNHAYDSVNGGAAGVFPNLRETAPCAVEKRPRRALEAHR